jgi:hypothetical protein
MVTATGIFTNNSIIQNVTLQLWNIMNPSPAMLLTNFIGTIGNDTSAPSSTFQLTAGSFQSCSI